MSNPTHIRDLVPDPDNARKHNPRNVGMIGESLQEVGAARSIVIDEHNRILAGNGTVEAAADVGITTVRVVETDGNEIIAVKRTNLDERRKKRLALFDNRTAELATWKEDVIAGLHEDGLTQGMFTDDEIAGFNPASTEDWSGAIGALPTGEHSGFEQMTFTLSKVQADAVRAALQMAKAQGAFDNTGNANGNGNALARIAEAFLTVG